MKRISYQDLQLGIEKELQLKIEKKFKPLFEEDNLLNDFHYERKQLFYSLLVQSIDITDHYAVNYIIERIEKSLNIKEKIRVFLYQTDYFEINCFPRQSAEGTELLIFVNQLFFNNLTEDEQVGIIGHEVAHFLMNHFDLPVHKLIIHPYEFENIGSFKANILYWAKVKEITADAIGLVSNGFNVKAYSTAIIKHFTGLSDSSQSKFNISPLVEIVLKQYDYLAKDLFFNDISSTHPSMPLRVKIINSISRSKLIKYFNENVSDHKYLEYKKEYNNIINKIIQGIYPELYGDSIDPAILLPMSVAVILANGEIDKKEIKALEDLNKMFKSDSQSKEIEDFTNIFKILKEKNFDDTVTELIDKSINTAKEKNKNITKHMFIPILRILLLVAASDGIIEKSELDCIFRFAKEFDFTRSDIVNLIATQYKI